MNKNNKITIAIDGHAACGKSTLAKQLAEKLGYIYVDSGAMYRAITLFFLEQKVDFSDFEAVKKALSNIKIEFRKADKNTKALTYLNGENVEKEIRSRPVSQAVSEVSAIKAVRLFLKKQQQDMGKNKGIVMDGRDIGTVIFPNAELKLFVTASVDVRSQRRYAELQEKSIEMSLVEIQANLKARDLLDSTRAESPLRKAADAIILDNSNLTRKEQLDQVLGMAKERIDSLYSLS